jgi:hypothetical protein
MDFLFLAFNFEYLHAQSLFEKILIARNKKNEKKKYSSLLKNCKILVCMNEANVRCNND